MWRSLQYLIDPNLLAQGPDFWRQQLLVDCMVSNLARVPVAIGLAEAQVAGHRMARLATAVARAPARFRLALISCDGLAIIRRIRPTDHPGFSLDLAEYLASFGSWRRYQSSGMQAQRGWGMAGALLQLAGSDDPICPTGPGWSRQADAQVS